MHALHIYPLFISYFCHQLSYFYCLAISNVVIGCDNGGLRLKSRVTIVTHILCLLECYNEIDCLLLIYHIFHFLSSSRDHYVLGTDDEVNLNVFVENLAEDAFESTVKIEMPKGVYYINVVNVTGVRSIHP